MLRFFWLTAILLVTSGFPPQAQEQAASPPTVPWERLTVDQIQSEAPLYPFELELNACIELDRLNRGSGSNCIDIPAKYCPKQTVDWTGVHAVLTCLNYATAYWDNRLSSNLEVLSDVFAERDKNETRSEQRVPLLERSQKAWHEWRAAKCSFIVAADDNRSQWRLVEGAACENELTAVWALDLELIVAFSQPS